MRLLNRAILLSLLLTQGLYAAEQEPPTSKCPILTAKDIKTLTSDRILKNGPHTWYLHDMFDLPETLGNHIPLDLSVQDVLTTKEIEFKEQLDARECEYKAVLGNGRHAHLTFRLMGD
jgi:hypothetical protein